VPTDRREKLENPKEDTLCNNGKFLNDLRIQYEKNQIVLKIILCTMMKKNKKLEEILKSMGQPCPGRPPVAHNKLAAKNEGPTYWLKLDFVSPPDRNFAKDSGIKRDLWATTETAYSQWSL
jgi:hypothetical protein